jgi:hypothetical protein
MNHGSANEEVIRNGTPLVYLSATGYRASTPPKLRRAPSRLQPKRATGRMVGIQPPAVPIITTTPTRNVFYGGSDPSALANQRIGAQALAVTLPTDHFLRCANMIPDQAQQPVGIVE